MPVPWGQGDGHSVLGTVDAPPLPGGSRPPSGRDIPARHSGDIPWFQQTARLRGASDVGRVGGCRRARAGGWETARQGPPPSAWHGRRWRVELAIRHWGPQWGPPASSPHGPEGPRPACPLRLPLCPQLLGSSHTQSLLSLLEARPSCPRAFAWLCPLRQATGPLHYLPFRGAGPAPGFRICPPSSQPLCRAEISSSLCLLSIDCCPAGRRAQEGQGWVSLVHHGHVIGTQ